MFFSLNPKLVLWQETDCAHVKCIQKCNHPPPSIMHPAKEKRCKRDSKLFEKMLCDQRNPSLFFPVF
jgi:hypothetical protein